ncbi:DegT/DnrJ/EryC1/StrS aminotransferase family protein [Alcanivorax sp. DP30]|uniref:DegT/DnrJ/EryC1/StrS family aminotransferase n=1 Tax=Alcanivorax sp. DP30 TaxID=2606217 RepID=UPI0013704172|nr:DegT/DnrJ/EryC1/StrS family aminotransferase [Alcanivorax sp. DP30]MZR64150.1 DegT/DnrJ/EryC1/StrS family aminotransferase [Alcanivorax sp. DP30]
MIPVVKPYLPSREKLDKYIDGIYERAWLSNNGPLVQELTARLEDYLQVSNLLLVSNGTQALQVAYHALELSRGAQDTEIEAITTPFSFIASASSLKWEGINPVFSDIHPQTWCLDPAGLESAITPKTRALVPVHVFGNACDVSAIDAIARKHGLKVIYDASHAFGVKFKGEGLLNHGDAATLSFHATKLFHTVEGGAVVFKRKEDLERARKIINFGIAGSGRIEALGINAKMNEFQAAMGLCVLDEIDANIDARSKVWRFYKQELSDTVQFQCQDADLVSNFSYAPIVLNNEGEVERVIAALAMIDIQSRRYFHPSLESLPCLGQHKVQPESSLIASRILCLPMYAGLNQEVQKKITNTIKAELNQ